MLCTDSAWASGPGFDKRKRPQLLDRGRSSMNNANILPNRLWDCHLRQLSSIFQFDDFAHLILATWTLKSASSTTRLIWLDTNKPHWCVAFRANGTHRGCQRIIIKASHWSLRSAQALLKRNSFDCAEVAPDWAKRNSNRELQIIAKMKATWSGQVAAAPR
jgi:hypothetical protein